jgi:hypothetical protein
MRIALGRVDLRALSFSATGEPPPYQVTLREGVGVSGELVRERGQLQLRELAAERLLLDALRLAFGSVLIRSERETVIDGLRGELTESVAQLALALNASALDATPLEVQTDQLTLSGEASMQGVTLQVSKDGGSLKIERLAVRKFRAQQGPFTCATEQLSADGFELGWGAEVRVSATRVQLEELPLNLSGDDQLVLQQLTCTDFSLRGARISVGSMQVERAQLRLTFGPTESRPELGGTQRPPPARAPAPNPAANKAFDLSILDGLSGVLSVDAHVDFTIPIFGTRRAKHELRLGVEAGTVDYREIEGNLAPLENLLLDFSLRDDGLVLERGIPLLPTRGFGKPILRWPLSPSDRALATNDRVRLSLLPRYEVAGKARDDERDDDDEPSESKLRKLALHNIDLQLSLSPIPGLSSALRAASIERLSAQGSILHRSDDPHTEGAVSGSMRGLSLSLDALGLGARLLTLQTLSVARVPRWQLRFAGLSPQHFEVTLEGLSVTGLRYA